MIRRPFAVLPLLAAALPAGAQVTERAKLYFEPCPPFAVRATFDCYHSYSEVTAFLRSASARYPQLAKLESIGRSWQGRDLWVLTITDAAGGEAGTKPGVWVDGGIDADEVVATEAALGLVHRLLTSQEPAVQELRRTRTFYIAPVVIPDASELHHTTPIRPRDTTLRPWDDDNDGELDEDGPDDLDGDGQALQMRRVHPLGEWVTSEEDARIMRRRRTGDAGPFYRLYPEALDDDGDDRFGEDPVGGVDPNRNYPGNWSLEQGGNGPFAGSEAELRAMLDFIVAHPDIAASQHLHSAGGVVLRPPSVPDFQLPAADHDLYVDLSRRGLQVTGYDLATSVIDWNWPADSRNTKRGQVWRDRDGELQGVGGSAYPAYGGSIDAMYALFGIVAFANEIYRMGTDLDGDGRVEPHEQLIHNDSVQKGFAFKDWTPFDHPQLGRVEIGGWRKFGHNNPPPAELPEEVRRNVEFVLMQAANTQRLEWAEVKAESLGGGIFRVSGKVRNTGRVPTELAIRERNGRAVPVRAALAGPGVEILGSERSPTLGTIAGFAEKEVEWIVRAPSGSAVELTARHPKAGEARETVVLR